MLAATCFVHSLEPLVFAVGRPVGRPVLQLQCWLGPNTLHPASACRCGSFQYSSGSPSSEKGVSPKARVPSYLQPGPLTLGTQSVAPPSPGPSPATHTLHGPSWAPFFPAPRETAWGGVHIQPKLSLGLQSMCPAGLCARTLMHACPSVTFNSQSPFPWISSSAKDSRGS